MILKDKNKRKALVVESTQQNIPFVDIHAGLLVTRDRHFIKILEIKPIPFTLRSFEEQDAIISQFGRVLKICPNNIQITVLTLPSDINQTLNALKGDMDKETSENCYRMAEEYKEELVRSKRSSVTRRFFLSFQFEDPSSVFHNVTIDEVVRWMDNMTARIKNALESCGNEVIDPEIKDENYWSAEILYTILNRREATDTPFQERVGDIYERYQKEKEGVYVPLAEYIAPEVVRFKDRRYVEVDGTYYRYLYIKSDGYPEEVFSGWLNLFINSYPGVDMNLYFERVPKEYVINDVRKNIVYNKVDHAESSDTSEAFEHSDSAMGAGYYLKNGLASGDDFYRVSVLISISNTSREIADRIAEEMKRSAAAKDIKLKDIQYNAEDAFYATLPIVKMPDSIWKKANRNMLSLGAASFYPFISFELNDSDGIYFGKDLSTNAMTIVDVFDSKKYTNANMFVCGTTGSGKTFSTLLISARTRIKHIPFFLVTPE
ncbi:MAG: hypothetical protein IIY75_09505, partial [Erysipelotrichales bacterium]|nr:hypothetical protein [Erysipelotrichales bacterium]